MLQLFKKIGIIIGLFVLNVLQQYAVALIIRETGTSSLVTILACLLVQFLAIGIFLYYAKRRKLLSLNWRKWITIKGIGIALLGFLVLFVVANIGSNLLSLEGRTTTGNQEIINQMMTQLPLPVMFVMIVIVAPVTEEIICRGLIPDLFPEKYFLLGHVLGTLAFASIHLAGSWGVVTFLLYASMGAVLAFVYYKSKKLEYSILAHAFHNGFIFLAMLLQLLLMNR